MKKRPDIQGLRAWAIIAVALFHFFPTLLPHGFLGVDVFFVLSGFLIALVLEREPVAVRTYIAFYFKRLRRIAPLLLLIVLCCSIFSAAAFGDVLLEYSERSALHAALFITNLKGRGGGEDYFRKLEKVDDFYTHSWSLSVEVQFYLLAPLLIHAAKASRFASYSTEYLLLMATTSWVYSKTLAPTAAFYSTIARLWQFLAGAVAFRLQNVQYLPITEEDAKDGEPLMKMPKPSPGQATICRFVVPSVLACSAILFDFALGSSKSAIRDAVTFAAAALLVLQLSWPILTHAVLQIIGDSSYSLYLIHWPIVCWLKMNLYEHWTVRLHALEACFVASLAVFYLYEKWYVTLREKGTLILVTILYLSCAGVFLSRHKNDISVTPTMQLKPLAYNESKAINLQMDKNWVKKLRLENCSLRDPAVNEDSNPFGFCNLPPGNGNLATLLIGNSYTANHGRLVIEHLRSHYSRIATHSVMSCEALLETADCKKANKTYHQEFLHDVDSFKPDVLFIMARYIEPNAKLTSTNISDDPIYKEMMRNLKIYEAKVKKVFILQALPRTMNLQLLEDAAIKKGRSPTEWMNGTDMDAAPMRKRVEELAKNCEKCVVYDVMTLHMDNGRFMTSNPINHLHYFELAKHYTPVGLKLVEPLYRKMAKNFDALLKSKWPGNLLTMDS